LANTGAWFVEDDTEGCGGRHLARLAMTMTAPWVVSLSGLG
jgi:hypothetical protein